MRQIEYYKTNADFIVDKLSEGKIFVVPTDTCFGLLAKITPENIERIYQIKERPKEKSLPIFVKKEWVEDFIKLSKNGEKLIEKFWPGALTIVGYAQESKLNFLKPVLGAKKTIALREPDYDIISRILNQVKEPLTATSANISGRPSCYSADEILAEFKGKKVQPDYFINTHQLPKRKSSTIIEEETGKILRQGEISRHAITETLKE